MTGIRAATMSQKYRYFDKIDQVRKLSNVLSPGTTPANCGRNGVLSLTVVSSAGQEKSSNHPKQNPQGLTMADVPELTLQCIYCGGRAEISGR
jgi:hypothetical protein